MKLIAIWLAYFVSLLAIAAFFSSDGGTYGSINAGVSDVLNQGRFGDPTYFLTAALDIANNGWIGSDNDWIFNLWPPGFGSSYY